MSTPVSPQQPAALWCLLDPGAVRVAFVDSDTAYADEQGDSYVPRTPVVDVDALPFGLRLAVPRAGAPTRIKSMTGGLRIRFGLLRPDGEALFGSPLDPLLWASRTHELVARVREVLEQLPFTFLSAAPSPGGDLALQLDSREGDPTAQADGLVLLGAAVQILGQARHVAVHDPVVFFRDGSAPVGAGLYDGPVQ